MRILTRIATSSAVAVAALAALPATAAHAAPTWHVATINDTCSLAVVNSGDGTLGEDTWIGAVFIRYVAGFRQGAPIEAFVDCELKVNGVSWGSVLSAPGAGVVAHAGRIEYTVPSTEVVELCSHVTVDGTTTEHCARPTVTPVAADPDPALCLALDGLGATLNGLNPVVRWDTAGRNLYVLEFRVYDCPPYVV
ncbi:MAG TPA: hypothetical protein VF519_01245 [Mycobacteriales bacterium]|jgi:hypothetical protein